jgi:hypothetical protein
MKKCSFFAFLLLSLSATLSFPGFAMVPTAPPVQKVATSSLTVTKVSSTAADMSWTPMAGSGNYRIKVIDLTLNQTFGSYSTANTVFSVSGLTTGHLYSFSVERAGYVIAEDLIM